MYTHVHPGHKEEKMFKIMDSEIIWTRPIAISCLTWLTVMQYDKMHFENVLCSAQMSFLVMCSDNTFYHIASLCNSAINVGQYQRI